MQNNKICSELNLKVKTLDMQNKYAIQSNVPLAPLVRKNKTVMGHKHRWPLAKLKIGESFFIPVSELSENVRNGFDYPTHNVTSVIHNHRKALNLKATFTTREVKEEAGHGVRVWRKS